MHSQGGTKTWWTGSMTPRKSRSMPFKREILDGSLTATLAVILD